jgi:hypothetical protein
MNDDRLVDGIATIVDSGLRPGPMRTALRGKAFQANTDLKAKPASDYAAACVELLSVVGAPQRGRIVELA